MKRHLTRLAGLFLSIIMIAGLIIPVYAEEIDANASYTAIKDYEYIKIKQNGNEFVDAACVESDIPVPLQLTDYNYADEDSVETAINNNKDSLEGKFETIKKLIYVYTNTNQLNEYASTDLDKYQAVWAAIADYACGILPPHASGDWGGKAAYEYLKDKIVTGEVEVNVPSGLELAFFQNINEFGHKTQTLVALKLFGQSGGGGSTEKEPTIATKVSKKEIEAAKDQTFKDTVTLENLKEGVKYTITGTLMDKEKNADVGATCDSLTFTASAEDAAAATVTKEMTFTFDATDYADKELVVFETLSWKDGDNEKSVKHENLDDADQTLKVKAEESEETQSSQETSSQQPTTTTKPNADRNAKISTTVSAGDQVAASSKEARLTYNEIQDTVIVTDEISYEGLLKGESYEVTGTLVEVDAKGKIIDDAVVTEADSFKAADTKGTWSLDFGEVQLEPYKKYVVFEEVYSANDEIATAEKPLVHKDVNDKAQTILTENKNGKVLGDGEDPEPVEYSGNLSTTVSINNKSASATAARTLTAADAAKVKTVTDTIQYTGLQGGDTYTLTGKLVKVKDGEVEKTVSEAQKECTADDSGEGEWKLDFTDVKLEADSTYVVFEKAVNTDSDKAEDIAEHKDVNDKAQTIIVEPAKETKSSTTTKSTAATTTNKTTAPKTGDTANTALWIAIMAAACVATGVIVARKRRAER